MNTESEVATNPYAPPANNAVDVARPASREAIAAGYKDQSLLLKVVLGVLGVQGLASLFNVAACAGLMFADLAVGTQERLVTWSGSAAQLSNSFYLIGVLPFAAFLVRANYNARALCASDPEDALDGRLLDAYSPASMFWWFLVPFMNLTRPYRAVQTVWRCSTPDLSTDEEAARKSILTAWWAMWLIQCIAARALSQLTAGDTRDPFVQNAIVSVGNLIAVASCFFAARMLRSLQQRQAQWATAIWG